MKQTKSNYLNTSAYNSKLEVGEFVSSDPLINRDDKQYLTLKMPTIMYAMR